MKRLTKLVDGQWRENHDNETRETKNKNGNRACMTKLAEYENTGLTPQEVAELIKAEQKKGLTMPLCKIGDIVYRKAFFSSGYFKVTISSIKVIEPGVIYVATSTNGDRFNFNENAFGVRVFQTEAETQQNKERCEANEQNEEY